MSKANDRQVGGDHYSVMGRKFQHWDVARMFNFDPMQYQITKHVFRWKDKFKTFPERLADLEKALHYLQKYIEDAKTWDDNHVRFPATHLVVGPRIQADVDKEYQKQMDAAVRFEADGFIAEGTRYQCKMCRGVVLAHSPLGADALHSYVDCERRQQERRTTAVAPSQSAATQPAPTPGAQLLNAP